MIFLLVALFAILILYSRSVHGGFLFDDHAITDMHFERWERAWKGIIYPDRPARFRYALQTLIVEPRGLTHMGYYWTWKLAGFRPAAWHRVNMALHFANTVLLYLFCRDLYGGAGAGIAAILFAVHPHQVAAVSYISGRASLQTTFFSVAGIYLANFGYPRSLWLLLPCITCAVFAQLSKEDGFLWILGFGLIFLALRFWLGSI